MEIITKKQLKDIPLEKLVEIYVKSRYAMSVINELDTQEEWERSIFYANNSEAEMIYDNRDVIVANHKIMSLFVIEAQFGEIIYN